MKRIAVITGASSGLGAAFAAAYTDRYAVLQGCDELWLIARRAEALTVIAEKINTIDRIKAPKIRIFSFDIGGTNGVSQFRTLLAQEKEYGTFTIILLINNAGFGVYCPFAETAQEELLQMIDVNIYALTGFCAAALPFMQRDSFIINVASMAAFLPVGNFSVYAATKSYVLSFSISLRAELKERGIGVTAVCPGQTATEFARRAVHNPNAVMPKGAKDPQKIALHGLQCAFKKHPTAVCGLSWKIQAFMTRFIGKSFFARITFRFVKRINNPDAKRRGINPSARIT